MTFKPNKGVQRTLHKVSGPLTPDVRLITYMPDYTDKYITDGQFDICRLINDDFILAIKATWNSNYYTSCLKLLVSFIDTMAFVDNGDSTGVIFRSWLDSYVDLSGVGITSDELWEHRNAILHMTTYESRKVTSGTVRRLVPYVGRLSPPSDRVDFKYYSLHGLIMAVMHGLGNYINAMDRDDAMRRRFCDNYEKTISDSHFSKPLEETEQSVPGYPPQGVGSPEP